jgi:hypothetical protein
MCTCRSIYRQTIFSVVCMVSSACAHFEYAYHNHHRRTTKTIVVHFKIIGQHFFPVCSTQATEFFSSLINDGGRLSIIFKYNDINAQRKDDVRYATFRSPSVPRPLFLSVTRRQVTMFLTENCCFWVNLLN